MNWGRMIIGCDPIQTGPAGPKLASHLDAFSVSVEFLWTHTKSACVQMQQAPKQLSPEIVRVPLHFTNGIIMNFKTNDVFRFVPFDWNDNRPDTYEFHHQRQFAGTVIHFCNARNHKIWREGLFPSQREKRHGVQPHFHSQLTSGRPLPPCRFRQHAQ